MTWHCDQCARSEDDVEIEACCHHCGNLLCTECRQEILDDALVGRRVGTDLAAFHCGPCRREHHPRYVPVRRIRGR